MSGVGEKRQMPEGQTPTLLPQAMATARICHRGPCVAPKGDTTRGQLIWRREGVAGGALRNAELSRGINMQRPS